jgi:hypothetical protein
MWSTRPMSLPEAAEIETLPIGDLRSLVARLLDEIVRLREENAALRAENAELKDEIARLKRLPPRPKRKPSGLERASDPSASPAGKRPGRRGRRGAKRDRRRGIEDQMLTVPVPAGSRFKGYEDVIVQDLLLMPRVIRYRRERWRTPDGKTITAPLPAGIQGGFGPALRRFLLAGHIQGQVTAERLTALLAGIGVAISKRQVVRLLSRGLDGLIAEDREVLRAGLATAAPWPAPSRRPSAARTGSTALRSMDHRRRHRRPPCRAQRRDHPDRRRTVHRVPHRLFQVAHQLPRLSARRPYRPPDRRDGAGLHAPAPSRRAGARAAGRAPAAPLSRSAGLASAPCGTRPARSGRDARSGGDRHARGDVGRPPPARPARRHRGGVR